MSTLGTTTSFNLITISTSVIADPLGSLAITPLSIYSECISTISCGSPFNIIIGEFLSSVSLIPPESSITSYKYLFRL